MCIGMYIFCLKKPHKQKGKETKQENRKTKEIKKEKEKGNIVVVNSICRKSNGIR